MNLTKGCKISITEPYFKGSHWKPKYVGERRWEGIIIKDTYGQKMKHWFTIEVTQSDNDTIKVGSKIRRQGNNLYKNCYINELPVNHKELCSEKLQRKEAELGLAE